MSQYFLSLIVNKSLTIYFSMPKHDQKNSVQRAKQALWPTYILTLFLGTLLIAWHSLSFVDFGYSKAYQWLSIQEHIQRFAPTNQYRKHFETTTKDEHLQLFSEIVDSIQQSGEGLKNIRYQYKGKSIPLLHRAEVIHLEDVAILIDTLYPIGVLMILISILLIILIHQLKPPSPSLFQATSGLGVLLIICAATLVIAGPKDVFYWLHTQIFPEGHQWFFYYQESLMTTLMKAPDLFGLMAAFVGIWTLVLYGVFLGGSLYIQRQRT